MSDGKTTAINFYNLLGIIKRLKNEELTIEASNNNLIIKQNKSTFKLPYDVNEYPSLNKSENLKDLNLQLLILLILLENNTCN